MTFLDNDNALPMDPRIHPLLVRLICMYMIKRRMGRARNTQLVIEANDEDEEGMMVQEIRLFPPGPPPPHHRSRMEDV